MTPILQTLIPLVRQHAEIQQGSWCQGNPCISGSPNDELDAFLESHSITPEGIQVADRDMLYDAYLDGVDAFYRHRLALPHCSPAAAPSAVSAPSVPDVVKIAQKALEPYPDILRDLRENGDDLTPATSTELQEAVESALSALRLLTAEPEGSPEGPSRSSGGNPPVEPDVVPLGEANGNVITYRDGDDTLTVVKWVNYSGTFLTMRIDGTVSFSEAQTRSLAAHLQAWLLTGSFDLKGLPSSPPSSEDKELLEDAIREIDSLLSRVDDEPECEFVRSHAEETIARLAQRVERICGEASTTPQKEGKES